MTKQDLELSLEELHMRSLRIVVEIDAFCRQNGIRYTLAFGSLLGAIRHKGFIPWDDDMDLAMPRPDYERFVRLFHAEGLVCVAPETNTSYLTFARVADARETCCKPFLPWSSKRNDLGVWVDIFPIDGEPDNMDEFSSIIKSLTALNDENREARGRILLHPSSKNSLVRNLKIIAKKILLCPRTPLRAWRTMMKLLKETPYGSTQYAGVMVLPVYGTRNRTRTQVFESYTRALFENYELSIISNYDEYLRDIYDDYLQLPPEEKRVPRHSLHKFYLVSK